MSGPWSKWTQEDWSNAEYCPDCGLPLVMIEPEEGENIGVQMCVFCTWLEDEGAVSAGLKVQVKRQETQIGLLEGELRAAKDQPK